MKRAKPMTMVLLALALLCGADLLTAHCQVPCGIYDDEAQFKLLLEHVATLEKAMTQIVELAGQEPLNYNQIVRWVLNKEKHADDLSAILSHYFLAQRLVPATAAEGEKYAAYQAQLERVHRLLVTAMKAKQSTDLGHVRTLKELLGLFRENYFAKK